MQRIKREVFRALVGLTRNIEHFPGRWRVVAFLHKHCRTLDDLPPFKVEVAPRHFVAYHASDNCGVFVEGLSRQPGHGGIRPLLRAGDTVLDIGANIGHTTVSYAACVGPLGQVHAFEPCPHLTAHLRENVSRNRLTNVQLHPVVVSDNDGTTDFHVALDGASALSSLRPLEGRATRLVSVPCVTIDSLLPSLGTVSFVKIDVEGAELRVLQGMRKLIKRDKPLIQAEVTEAWMRELGGSAEGVRELLTDSDYILFVAVPEGFERMIGLPHGQFELLAVPSTRAVDVERLTKEGREAGVPPRCS
jgi:FkbM family methyltransferase